MDKNLKKNNNWILLIYSFLLIQYTVKFIENDPKMQPKIETTYLMTKHAEVKKATVRIEKKNLFEFEEEKSDSEPPKRWNISKKNGTWNEENYTHIQVILQRRTKVIKSILF